MSGGPLSRSVGSFRTINLLLRWRIGAKSELLEVVRIFEKFDISGKNLKDPLKRPVDMLLVVCMMDGLVT